LSPQEAEFIREIGLSGKEHHWKVFMLFFDWTRFRCRPFLFQQTLFHRLGHSWVLFFVDDYDGGFFNL